MDKIKFFQASALLKSFRANLPEDTTDLNQVDDYHTYLKDLEEQVDVPLNKFRIPDSAIKTVANDYGAVAGPRFGRELRTPRPPTTYRQYCDATVFRRQLDAVLIFIEIYMQDMQAELKAQRDDTLPA